MALPLISVIVPFYNMELFLEEAIESVISQTYTNWELLLIDDGSKDGSTAIAKSFAKSYPGKMKYFIHENFANKGLTATRNLGLQNAKGEYIALLDADDFWYAEKLAKQVAVLIKYPECAMIGGASEYWYSWSGVQKQNKIICVGGINDKLVSPPLFAYDLYPLGNGAAPCPCCLVIKTSIAKKHKGFEGKFTGIYQMYEDQAFLVKMYLHEKIFMMSECLDRYRQRSNSLVSSVYKNGEYEKVREFYLKWLRGYLHENNINDKILEKKIKDAEYKIQHPIIYKIKAVGKKIIQKISK